MGNALFLVPIVDFSQLGSGCRTLNGGQSEAGDEGSRPSPVRGWSWANVVGIRERQLLWTVNKVYEVEIDQLRRFFNKILEFLEDEMEEARGEWDQVALLARSLGWRVPINWVVKDFKIKGKLSNDLSLLP